MAHIFVACRDFVTDEPCTISLVADDHEELIEAAIEHAYAAHNLEDTPTLRQAIRAQTHEGVPA